MTALFSTSRKAPSDVGDTSGGGTPDVGTTVLDDDPVNDATEVIRTNAGEGELLFNLETIGGISAINAVVFEVRCLRGNGGATTFAGRYKVSTAANTSGFTPASGTYGWNEVPALGTIPSNQSEIDIFQGGLHHDGAREFDCSEIHVMVDHLTGATPSSTGANPVLLTSP